MSSFAWGFIHTSADMIELSYQIHRAALDNGFAVRTGFCIFDYLLKNFVESFRKDYMMLNNGELPYELISNPIEDEADSLLAGDIYSNGMKVESDNDLSSRMMRIQKFLCSCMSFRNVISIELNIDVEYNELNEYKQLHICQDDFCEYILMMYKQSCNCTPRARLLFTNDT